ncbi:MAG: starch-binding protein [Brevinematales bacterium]|nr:starch-binding protein [Brevinematales bacterium]
MKLSSKFFVLLLLVSFASCSQIDELTSKFNENSPIVMLTKPTNNQVVPSIYEIVGSAVAKIPAELTTVNVYCLCVESGVTNITNIVLNTDGIIVFRARFQGGAGHFLAWAIVSDDKGNSSRTSDILFQVDSGSVDVTPPDVFISTPTNNQPVGNSVTVSGTAEDIYNEGETLSGIDKVYVKLDSGTNIAAALNSEVWQIQFPLATAGSHTAYVYCTDKSGNSSGVKSVTFVYETGNPSVSISSPANGVMINQTSVNVSGLAAVDTPAAITSVQLSVNGGTFSSIGTITNTGWQKNGVTLIEGTNRIVAKAFADNGKSALSSEISVIADITAPQVSAITPAANKTFTNIQSVVVSGTSSDNLSGVDKVYVAVDAGSFNVASGTSSWSVTLPISTGAHTVKYYAKDKAGNQSAEKTVSFTVVQVQGAFIVYFSRPTEWTKTPKIHYWGGNCGSTTWPGFAMTPEPALGASWYSYTFTGTNTLLIFNNDSSPQTADLSRNKTGYYKNGTWYDSNPDDLIPPTASIASPANGASLSGIVTIVANASDNNHVAKVEFYRGTNKIGQATAEPYTMEWNTSYAPNGSHALTAKAYDDAGNTGTSPVVNVTTANANVPPVANAGVDITVLMGNSAQFDASASYDPNGTIVSYSWNNGLSGVNPSKVYSAIGNYTVTLTVTDNEGATGTDQVVVHVVTNVPSPDRIDFREETIYFLMTARFYDGDTGNNRPSRCYVSSGNAANNDPAWRGDFKGLIAKLDYIKALGFTAIWITPVVLNRSDYDYHGYHAWDFNKVDPRLESPGATYQDLINAAHAKGLKIIQDIVLNHTSRYGAVGLQTVKYWGDSNDPEWGDGTTIDYYDLPNAGFTYDGLSYEPVSGKSYYNGDLWQTAKPTLAWNPLTAWGTPTQWRSPEGYIIYNYQWPNLDLFDPTLFHKGWLQNWEDYTCQNGTIHEDCIDLNTESATVQQYLINAYNKYIDMGVDGFRIDTVKHISRWTLNMRFIPAFKSHAPASFYMFGEVCTRVNEVWNHGIAPLSTPFYTWGERQTFTGTDAQCASNAYIWENNQGTGNQPTSQNAFLQGNAYHTPDYSQSSGMGVIDFPMHWNFGTAGQAYNFAKNNDYVYNDSTWNVCYVDSHDYGPNTDNRYGGSEAEYAESFSLIFTFRGIPCVYYGSEIQFMKGAPCDKGPSAAIATTGRAYFGDHIAGSVNVTDFGVWNNATGEMANTLNHPLAKHLQRLNQIRHKIPALQKGQYSTDGCSGGMCFKKRFTSGAVDSFVLVTISGGAAFSGIPNGVYKDAITGDVKVVTDGTLAASCSGQGNMRIYVLDLVNNPAPGKIGEDGAYLHP